MSTATKSNWSWNEAPFSTQSDPRRFYPGISQEESLSRLHFLVENRHRFGILTGPSGSGKSLLLEVAAKQFRQQNRHVVQASLLGMDFGEFLWQLAAELGANPRGAASALQLWREISDRIAANRYQAISTVVLLDDAEEAETDVLAGIARLVQTDTTDDARLTTVVTCESGRIQLLGRRLQELCELRLDLEVWTEEEVAAFVRQALTAAACRPDLFQEDATQRLFTLSSGIPRRVQQLAKLALIAAEVQDIEQIDEETVEAVHRELRATAWN